MTSKQAAYPATKEDAFLPDATGQAGGQSEEQAQAGPDEEEDPDDLVEVVHEGRTYQVPRGVKPALMRQADYTRKTQDLAQSRKRVAAVEAHLVQNSRLHMLGLAHIAALDGQITPLARLNWGALNAQDPARALTLWRQYQSLRAARGRAALAIRNHDQGRVLEAQRGRATQIADGQGKLQQEIEGWSPDLVRRIVVAGKAHGFSEPELQAVSDPRMVKVLNKARLFDEQQARQAAIQRLTAAQAVTPATEVGAQAPAGRDPARMSTAEWMRWRSEQLRKKR